MGIQEQAKPEIFILIVILPNSAGPIWMQLNIGGGVKYGTSQSWLKF